VHAAEALAVRLPNRAEQIRRRYWRDPAFRAVCDDLRVAEEALARLEREAPPVAERVQEYRELLTELLAEAVQMLAKESDDDDRKA